MDKRRCRGQATPAFKSAAAFVALTVAPATPTLPRPHSVKRAPALKSAVAFVALTVALLTGCGFHLRGGDWDLNSARVYISGDDMEMVAELTAALTQYGATVLDSIDNPSGDSTTATRIQLHASHFDRATLTTDARGRASAFEIRYTVSFSVTVAGDSDGEVESRRRTVTLNRALDYDSSRQLQSEAESRFLEAAMRREAATRILQHIARR